MNFQLDLRNLPDDALFQILFFLIPYPLFALRFCVSCKEMRRAARSSIASLSPHFKEWSRLGMTQSPCLILKKKRRVTRWLCSHLAFHEFLRTLILEETYVGDEGTGRLAEALLPHASLKTLVLSEADIGDEGARRVGDFLRRNRSLLLLNVERNAFGLGGLSFLAKGVRESSSLTYLDASMNKIGDEGARILSSSIGGLQKLVLFGNEIRDQGASCIAKALIGSALQELDLSSNQIGDAGCDSLLACLSPNVRRISLLRNRASEECRVSLMMSGRCVA